MINLSNTGNLVKAVALYIVLTAYTGAIIVAAIDLATGRAIPESITALIASALGLALPALGLAHGVGLTNSDTAAAIKALAARAQTNAAAQDVIAQATKEGEATK